LSYEPYYLSSAAGSKESSAAQMAESPTATVTETPENSENQDDLWSKLKNVAG
jgi:hypothetical protein